MSEKPNLDKVLYRPIVFRTFDLGRNSRDALKCLNESGSTFPIDQGRNWVLRKPRASWGHRMPTQSKNTEILITIDVWLWRVSSFFIRIAMVVYGMYYPPKNTSYSATHMVRGRSSKRKPFRPQGSLKFSSFTGENFNSSLKYMLDSSWVKNALAPPTKCNQENAFHLGVCSLIKNE